MKNIFYCLPIAAFLAISCNSKTNSNSTLVDSTKTRLEHNKQTALKSLQAFSKGDMATIKQLIAPGFTDYGNGENKPMNNLDSVKVYLDSFRASFPDATPNNPKAFASGDTVLITDTWTGTFTHDMMGVKATGKKFKYPDVEILIFDNAGKILSHRAVQSDGTLLRQVGTL